MLDFIFKKLAFVAVFLLAFITVNAQQTNNWYFGSPGPANKGLRIDFSSGSPVVTRGYPISTMEGSSSISDASGAPLFYTDGVTVWDGATNAVLPGGTGLQGHSSSTQSAIIMPKPGSTTQWLLFTSYDDGAKNYYTVTGTTPTGPFSVSAGTLLAASNVTNQGLFIIGSTKVGSSFWVIARDQGSTGVVRAWDVSNTGVVNTTAVTSTLSGPSFTNATAANIGTIKSNTCQNKLAFSYLNSAADIVDFNTATGQVVANTAKRITVPYPGGNSGSYGLEFSSNDAYLYITNLAGNNLSRYDIVANTVNNSFGSTPHAAGQLQMGPDGKIYMAIQGDLATGPGYIGVITNPNLAGATFNASGLLVTNDAGTYGFSYWGLPTFPKSLVVSTPTIIPGDGTYCANTAIPLSFTFAGSIDASGVTWTSTGGGTFTPGGASSTSLSPSITFTTTGVKTVTLSFNDVCGRPYSTTRNYTIIAPKTPAGTKTCSGTNNLRLDATGTISGDYPNYVWYDAPSGGNIVGVGNPVNLLYPNAASVPANYYVEVGGSVSVTSSGTNQSIASPASLTWAANPANYTVTGINVLANTLSLKSITVRPYNGTANGVFSVTIRQGATLISTFNYNVGPSYVNGNTIVVPINQTLLQGTGYSIQLQNVSGMSGGWWGGSWAGGTNVNQITYPAQGTGTNGVFALVYDYQNYTVTTTCSNRVLVSGTCTLPVSWLDISAKRNAENVLVKWSVASEVNNQRFEVQRSVDGVNFETIGVVPGKGTRDTYSEYEFVDYTSEKGKLYYRIVQYDFDGQSSLSRVVTAESLNKSLNQVVLYPNPTAAQFTVSLSSTDDIEGMASVRVINSIGQEVYSQQVDASDLTSGVVVDLSSLPQGNYLVRVTTNSGEWIEQLLKR